MEFFRGRTGLLVVTALVCLLWSVAPAPSQGVSKKDGPSPTGKNGKNRVIVYPKAGETVDQLKQRGLKKIDNYGSYWVATATDEQLDSLRKTHGNRVVKANHLNRIELAAAGIDTTVGEPAIASHLRQFATDGKRLMLIQFKGPIQPKWLEQVKTAGQTRIVSYVPNNAYIVWGDADSAKKLAGLTDPNGPIQWMGAYHPSYKIPQELLTATGNELITVRVAVVDDSQEPVTANGIRSLGSVKTSLVRDGQEIIEMEISPAAILPIAQLPGVLWIEKVMPKRLLDEVQDLVLTSQTNSGAPLFGPSTTLGITNYLDFLTGTVASASTLLSFITATNYPVVDIADTGFDNGTIFPYHPAFYPFGNTNFGAARVSYIGPPWLGGDPQTQLGCNTRIVSGDDGAFRTLEAADLNGHGTFVASIVTGFDSGTNILGQPTLELRTSRRDVSQTIPGVDEGGKTLLCTSATQVVQFNTGVTNVCFAGVVFTNITFTINTNDCPVIVSTNVLFTRVVTNFYNEIRVGSDGFQLGMGVSPFGLIGIDRVWGTMESAAFSISVQQGVCTPRFRIGSLCISDLPALIAIAYTAKNTTGARGARIQNNSWGDPIDVHGSNGGAYTSDSQTYDIGVRDAVILSTNSLNQEFIVVFACNSELVDAGQNGGPGGFAESRVTAPATAKNVISVGSSVNPRDGGFFGAGCWDQIDSFEMARFSAAGPTIDGRFKPEIVAPGSSVYVANNFLQPSLEYPFTGLSSTNCSTDNLIPTSPDIIHPVDPTCTSTSVLYGATNGMYLCVNGSSYAAPAVSGGIQLLWWYFENRLINQQNDHLQQPSPAMAKAYLCNSARYLAIVNPQTGTPDTLPSILQGMGEMDLLRMFDGVPRAIRDESSQRAIDSPLTKTNASPQQTYFSQAGQSYEVTGQVANAGLPLRVTLAWTDAPGSPNQFQQLNNDLDLEVTVNGVTYKGNVFSEDASVPGGAPDSVNIMESVYLPAGVVTAGTGFKAVVRAANIVANGVPNVGTGLDQDFALVIYNSTTNYPSLSDLPNPNLSVNNTCETALNITNSPRSVTNTFVKSVDDPVNGYANVHPSPTAGTGGVDEFFKLTVPAANTVFAIDTAGSLFSNVLSIWRVQVVPAQTILTRGECGALTEVVSDNSGGWTNILSFVADGSNDYYIVVEPQDNILPGAGARMILNVSGIRPAVSIDPLEVDFGNQNVGTTSTPVGVNILNTGTVPVTITSVTLAGANPSNFLASANCINVTLLPSNSCTVAVNFAPLNLGANNATLLISTTETNTPRSVLLTGNGVSPAAAVATSPSTLTFGDQTLGTTSVVQSVTITNIGSADLVITNFAFSLPGNALNDFIVTGTTCLGISIPSNGVCTVSVAFVPTGTGARAATLQIFSNGGAASVDVTGTGIAPAIQFVPTSLNFQTQQVNVASAPLSVAVKNVGFGPLTISSVSIVGTNATNFTIIGNACLGTPIAPGDSCSISLTFRPTALTNYTGSLRIVSDATNAPPVDLPLSGFGTNGVASIGFIPALLPTFGNVTVGTTSTPQTVIVTNGGSASLLITNITLPGSDFILTNSTCLNASIAPGGTCTFQVLFTPTTSGNVSTDVFFYSNSGGPNPAHYLVKGAGVAPNICPAPADLLFGTQAVNIVSAPLLVTIFNCGDAPLTITNLVFVSTNATDFSIANNTCLGSSIAPGDSCGISVTFRPGALGNRSGQLQIWGNEINSPRIINLSGVGTNVAPSIGFSPLSITFPDQTLNTTSTIQLVTVTNTGNASLALTNAIISTGDSTEFSVTNNLCLASPILPGGTCTIGVVFHPNVSGIRATTLFLYSNSGGSPHPIQIFGTGIAPVIGPLPVNVYFGAQPVNITSAPQSMTVSNTGDGPLVISSVTISGTNATDFAISADTCLGTPIAPGDACGISVTFTPGALSNRFAQLTITGNATNSPQIVLLNGTGTNGVPSLGFSPTSVQFGNLTLGTTSAIQTVTLTNAGNAALVISQIALNGGNNGDFIITNDTCTGFPVATGGVCSVGVIFTTTNSGPRSTALRIFSNSGTGTNDIPVAGVGVAPSMELQPQPLTFGTQAVSIASAPLTVNVQSKGDAALTVTNIQIIGANAGSFAVSNNCAGLSVAPGSSCGLVVTFTPSVLGTNTAKLFVYGDATNSPQTVTLFGIGTNAAPTLLVIPNPVVFNDQPSNTTSAVTSVTVTNTGNATLAIINVFLIGPDAADFSVTNNLCGSVLPGGTCTLGMKFRPTALGTRTATLEIDSNSGTGITLVPVNGNGVAPAMALSPNPLSFGTQAVTIASAPLTVNVNSVGDSALTITNVTLLGTNSAAFSFVNNCAGGPVAPGGSCGLSVTFTPVVLGSNTAQLLVYGIATNSPQLVNLVGIGTNVAPTAIVTPTTLNFGNQPSNTTSAILTVTVTNTGNATLAINSVAFTGGNAGDFSVTNNLCGSVLPGQTCSIGAVFKPTALGARASTLRILSNAGTGTNDVAVNGNGVAPAMALSPNPLSFGTQAVTIASAPLTVNVNSVGDSALTITNVTLLGTNSAAFSFVNNCAGGPVAPGGSCGLSVTFTPVVLGSNTAQLLVYGIATNSPQLVNLVGIGTNVAPTAIVTPTTLNFGNQPSNTTSAILTVTVTNTGNATLAINSVAFTGGNAGDFSVTNNLCGSVLPGQTCSIGAVFKPTALGARASTLRILSNAGTGTNDVAVNGNGVAPAMALSPNPLSFGTQAVTIASAPLTVNVNSVGDSALTITNVTLLGTNSAAFSFVNNCAGGPVAPGGSCGLSVTFTPVVLGSNTAQLLVYGIATNSPQLVNLVGIGTNVAPTAIVTPTTLNFGNQPSNTTSAILTVTVTNTGNATLAINSVAFTGGNAGDFSVTNNLCGSVLPGQTCSIGAVFKPTALGARASTLRILSNAGTGTNDVAVNGNGVAPAMALSPNPLSFGTQAVTIASAPLTVNVNSVGDSALTITNVTLLGTNSAAFSFVNNCAGGPVAPGGSCGLSVTFTPVVLGSNTAQLLVYGIATNSPQLVNLVGIGTNVAPTAIVTPTTLNFGNQPSNTTSAILTVTVTNTGNATLAINSVAFTGGNAGDFSVTNNLCGSVLPGQTCSIGAVFKPTALGARASTLRILSNAGTGTNDVAVNGNGVAPAMALSPNPLSFGTQAVTIASAPLTVNVNSVGDSALTITNVTLLGTNSAAFSFVNNCAGGPVAPGGSCGLSVTFTPVVLGSNTAQLLVYGIATNSPQLVNLVGIGTNVAPTAIVTPTTLNFGNQPSNTTSAILTVTVTNTGNATLAINSVAFTGGNAGDFSVTNNLCGSVLPGQTCSIGAVFKPTALGARASTLRILSNAGTGTNDVAVNGNGVAPAMALSPNPLSFGTQAVTIASAPLTVNVNSVGDSALTITNVTLLGTNSAAFSFVNNCAGGPVAPGGSCGLSVTFTPVVLGSNTAQLLVYGIATNSPQLVNLVGIGTNVAPTAIVTPTTLNFGNQPSNTTSAILTVTVTNTGNATLAINSVAFTGGNAGDFSVTNNLCGSVLPGQTCSIGAVFKPTALGARASTLRILSNAGTGTNDVAVNGNGVAPAMALSPNPLSFGTQAVTIASAPLTVNVNSVGDSALTITNVTLLGTNSAAFSFVNNCAGGPVAPGGSCGLSVTFTPVVLGSNTAQLLVYGIATNSPQLVNLVGIGTNVAPTAIVTPTTLNFGNQPSNTTSAILTVTVTNTGNATLAINSVAFTGGNAGDFSVTNNLCGSVLPGQTCSIGAVFKPTALGARASTLRILSNAGTGTNDVAVNGNGVAPAMALSPNPLSFGTQAVTIASAPLTVNVNSVGDSALTITNVTLLGTNSAAFSFVNNCAGGPVAPGGSCGLSVTFTPVVLGSNTAQLLVYGIATNSPQLVNLVGIGTNVAPTAIVTPTTLNFGNQPSNTTSAILTVTVTNTGNATLAINSVAFTGGNAGDFSVTNNLCGSVLPGQTCSIGAVFKPTALGARASTLRILSNAGTGTNDVAVNGNGVAPAMALSPNPLSFGTQAVTIASAPLTVNVNSVGDSALTITNVTLLGTNSAAFSFVNNCAGGPVAPGGSCGLSVTFTPVVLGSNTAQLLVYGIATNSPQLVNLVGIGTNVAPTAIVTPTTLNFGNQPSNTTSAILTVTVTNTGNATLAINSVAFTGGNAGDFSVTNNLCGSVLPGQTCSIGAVFKPTALGARASTLRILSNAGTGTNDVAVNGNGVAPAMALSPNPLSFGTQAVTIASAPLTVNVNSVGDSALTITNVTLLGTNSAAFSFVNNCAGGPVAPGGSCGLSVTFTPVVLGSNTAQLLVYGIATNSPQLVNLVGIGTNVAPTAIVTPTTLNFGNQPSNTTSAILTVTVTNTGNATLAINSVAFTGGNAGDFSVTNNLCGSVLPGQTCSIGAVFKPTALGARASTLRILSNAGTGTNDVAVNGNGVAPAMALNPTALNFNTQAVSITSAPLTVNVLSVGDSALTITNVTIIGTNAADFAVTTNSCAGSPIPPGSSCGLTVTFTPSALGNRTAQLVVYGNATNSPKIVNLSGVGTNTAPSASVTPASLAFGSQALGSTSTVLSVTVSNTGNATLAITNAVLAGGNAGDFFVTNNLCGSIAPGTTCTIGVAFKPTALGARASTLQIFNNSGVNPLSVPVTGNGSAPAMLVSPTSVNFGTQSVSVASSPQFVIVQSIGDAPLTVTNVTIIGTNAVDFTVTTNACLGALAPGDSCGISITFRPSALGTRTAQLVISGNATNSPQIVNLSGIGSTNAPALLLDRTTLLFGDQLVGTTSAVQQVTVSNPGTAALVISAVAFSGGDTGDFIIVNNTCLGAPIPAGGNCVIGIASAPKKSGLLSTALQILSNAGNGTNTVPITGSGVAPVMTLSTNALDFGTNTVNSTSGSQSVFIQNTGNAPLDITSVTVGGLNPGDFTIIANSCVAPIILPGQGCQVTLVFSTSTTLPRSAQLIITGNATNSPQTVSLTGVGAPFICGTITLVPAVLPNASATVPYLQVLTATGGTDPYSFQLVSGALPAGLTLTTAGVISGTPTSTGTASFVIMATDVNGCTGSQSYSISVSCPTITFFPAGLPGAVTGTPYIQTIVASGGSAPYSFAVTSGGLPPGLSLSTGGLLAGTPTLAGSYTFTVTVTDAKGCIASQPYTLLVGCPPLLLLPVTFQSPVIGVAYSQTNSLFGGTPPTIFAVTSGAVPPGLSYLNGVLSGMPTTVGTFNFTITATDANGCSTNRAYSVTVSCGTLSLVPQTVPDGSLGAAYSQTFTVSGHSNTVTFTQTAGTRPPGLNLSPAGVLSGTPTLLGSFTFKVSALDFATGCTGERFYTIKINCPTVTISPSTLPFGAVGTAYSQTFAASGGVPPYVFTQTSGSLPVGMSLSPGGVLSGTPLSGSTIFAVTATDSNGCNASATYTLVLADNCPPIMIQQISVPNAIAGQPYNQTLTASGGVPPHTFAVYSGALPPGMNLSPSGVLSGTPATTGTVNFTAVALDGSGCAGFQSYTFTVSCDTITVSPSTLATGIVTLAYSQTLTATGGLPPRTFAVSSGTLPGGLVLDPSGALTGTPTNGGNFVFTAAATDAANCVGSQLYTLSVVPAADLGVSKTDSPDPIGVGDNLAYSIVVTNRGPSAATGVVLTDTLPAGVSFVSASSGCTPVGNVVTCNLGTMPTGTGALITIVVNPTTSGLLTNTVSVTSSTLDLNPANNTATAITTVNPSVQVSASTEIASASAGAAIVTVTRLGRTDESVGVQYGTADGTAVAGTDYVATAGQLNFDIGVSRRTVTVPLIATSGNSHKTAKFNLSNPSGGAVLGARTSATINIVNSAKPEPVVFTNSANDIVTVKLAGAGAMQVSLLSAAGPIDQIAVTNTDAKSSLTVSVKHAKGSDGHVEIGGIVGAGSLKNINAKTGELTGSGINLGGSLGNLKIHAISNSTVSASGGVTSVSADEIKGSLITAGFAPTSPADPMAGGTFAAGILIKNVKATDFASTTIAAAQIGTVNFKGVTTDNAGTAFGVLAQDSVKSVKASDPKFKWDSKGAADQSSGDFHVKH